MADKLPVNLRLAVWGMTAFEQQVYYLVYRPQSWLMHQTDRETQGSAAFHVYTTERACQSQAHYLRLQGEQVFMGVTTVGEMFPVMEEIVSRDTVDTQQTMRDLREMFERWEVEFWEPVPDATRSVGVTVRYLRGKVWQQVHCDQFPSRAQNLRQIYLLLDRLRVAEKHGVSYTGLTSSREIVAASPQAQQKSRLEEAYFVLGCLPDDPDTLVKDIYLKKAVYFHPDHGGDQGRMEQLNQAYQAICEARGIKA